MNNIPIYINLSLYSVFYDIMYFYISTYNIMMASNNNDFSSFSQNGCADVIIPNESEVKIFLTLCKCLKTFINQTNVAETFINP